MNAFKRIYVSLMLAEAVRRAESASRNTGERFYVIPDGAGHLVCTDRRNFRGLKRTHYINGRATLSDLGRDCFYRTAARGGKGGMTPEEQREGRLRCYRWAIERANMKKAARKAKRKLNGKAPQSV